MAEQGQDGDDEASNCFVFLFSCVRPACIRVPESGC